MINIYLRKIDINGEEKYENEKNASSILLYDKLHLRKDNLNYGFKGKPYVINNNIYFNISHSLNNIGIAISDAEVGLDIETIRNLDINKLQRLKTKIVNEKDFNEFKYIDSSALLKIWTIKESYLKYLGLGIITNPKEIEIDYKNETISMNNKNISKFKTFSLDDMIISVTSKDNNEIDIIKEY